jgi:phosphoribosylanthranilate isomerase
MSKIKICGLTRPEDIIAVNQVLPDYIGFVFANSRRQVTDDLAKSLKSNLDDSIKAVGIFVNDEPLHIAALCNCHIIDLIQLHGDEDANYITNLQRLVPNRIIKAIRVKDAEDIKRAADITTDFLLFDTYQEGQYGGSGTVFDWSILSNVEKPYFLAGGIHSDNILQAKQQCNPYCLDVSSGVETNGYKDPNKIIELVTKIRSVS